MLLSISVSLSSLDCREQRNDTERLPTSAGVPETMVQIILFPETERRRQSLCRRRKRCRLSLVGPNDERRKVNLTQIVVSDTQDRKDEGACNQLPAMPALS